MNLEIQINKLKYAKDKKRNAVLGWVDCDFILVELEEQAKEIERLNNIINELEKWLEEVKIRPYKVFLKKPEQQIIYEDMLDKLQELKGSE